MARYLAVLDIGKTNKKCCCFDEQLNLVSSTAQSFPPLAQEEGIQHEDHQAIWAWLQEQLAALYQRYPFAAIAVTTHGATYALIDADGQLTHPIIAYDSPLEEDLQRRIDQGFYALCGPLAELQEETGSCDMPLLVNPAKSLFYLQQQHPQAISRAHYLLNYPQFWGHLLTQKQATEATYTANHSFLFDIHRRGPSTAAKALGVDHLMDCKLRHPWDCLGTLSPELQQRLGLPALPVAVGIHDSNAALLPYLLSNQQRDFVLNSTGTWCVAMHRVEEARYAPEEREQKIIFNIDALGQLHKTSFLMGGQDYALYHELIGGEDPGFDPQRLDAQLQLSGNAILPGAFPCQFPGWHGGANEERDGKRVHYTVKELASAGPQWFADPAAAHDYLNAGLAVQTKIALERTGMVAGTAIFIEGGFAHNATYVNLLAELCPENPVLLTDWAQASAGGAALLALCVATGKQPQDFASLLRITEQAVPPPGLQHARSYEQAYRERLASC